jgi:diaminohydroxyphosphoribosylaminopyrimidine deaminase/5-amino-6-(5-phosphoribosylamino)uracil reductase
LEDRSPVRAVIGRRLEGLAQSRLALTARQHPLWLVCAESTPATQLEAAGARILRVPEVGGELWLPAVMETLVANGITRLLVEGGSRTRSAFSRAGLIDEAVLFQARGQDGAPLITERALATLSRYLATETLQQSEHRSVGGDDMMVFRRHWRSLGRSAAQPERQRG